MGTSPEQLIRCEKACVVAPAGYGKTQLIARAIQLLPQGRQLVLTHTHAGVSAITKRLVGLAVPSHTYRIETIAGFALKLAASFPSLSTIPTGLPKTNLEWQGVYVGCSKCLTYSAIQKIIKCSYAGLFVDEYQDCNLEQHSLILLLAGLLPCRIVGDPLQAIFDFQSQILPDWDKDIFPHFERMPDLKTPHRWTRTNPALGEWLVQARQSIVSGQLDMRSMPSGSFWMQKNPQNIRKVLFRNRIGTVVGIHRGAWGPRCHAMARRMGGFYQSSEETDSRELFEWCEKIDTASGNEKVITAMDFAAVCMTSVSTALQSLRTRLENGTLSAMRNFKYPLIREAAMQLIASEKYHDVRILLKMTQSVDHAQVFRLELYDAMLRSLQEAELQSSISLVETARSIRNRDRFIGRTMWHRCISRTLLVKGLEYDHAIVLDGDGMTKKELYVSITRGSHSLTLCSDQRQLYPN